MKHVSPRLLSLTCLGGLLALEVTPGLPAARSPSVKPVASLPSIRKSAETGSADAQLRLGLRYYNGDGVQIDLRKAAHWFQLAAEQGDRVAEYELGCLYQDGQGGLPRDDRRAIELFTRSAGHGFTAASLVLGVDYELGDGIARSRSQAIAYFLNAGSDGRFAANALASADAPPRLDGALTLGNFLASRRASPLPPDWSRSKALPHRAGEPPTLATVLSSRRHDEKSSTN